MRNWLVRATIAVLLTWMGATTASAQATGQITGVVSDAETGQPLQGAQVHIPDTSLGILANAQGRFVLLNVPAGEVLVRVLRIGYGTAEQTVTVTAGSTATVDFQMQPQAVELGQLVVTGYGEQRREDLTGAVAKVTAEDFVEAPARDAASLIVGKIAGVNIQTPSGDPRDNTEIMLRGVTTINGDRDPLVIVDGVPGSLETVAAQDIESIDVLKDGSAAAIYGSRATNGVIFITTKKHTAGTPPTIRYDGHVAMQSIYNQPDFLDASDYRRVIAQDEAAGVEPRFQDFGTTTDWQDVLLRTPVSHTHNLTLSGGAESTNYTASLGYESQEGTLERSYQDELTARVNVSHSMFDNKLQTDVNLLTRTETSLPNNNYPNYDYAWRQILIRNPTDRVYADDGLYQERGVYFYPNPVGLINEYTGEEEDRDFRLHGTVTLRPVQGLSLSMLAGMEKGSQIRGWSNTQTAVSSRLSDFLTAGRSTNSSEDRILELTGNYATTFGDHYVTLLGGYSYQDITNENFTAGNRDFPTDLFGWNALETGDGLGDGLASIGSGKSGYKVIGFFSRLNWDWQNRFLLMGSVRYEGNSKFGADHKWGLFPGVSVGWRLSEEGFLQDGPFDDLKVRAGFGVTGIAPDNAYESLTSYEYGARFPFNGTWVQGISPVRNPNPDLRWEKKEEVNVGVDFSLMDYRLVGSLDVYRRTTKDMLFNYDVPSPPFLYRSIQANVGHMKNSGIEADLTYDLIRSADLRWQVGANWSHNTNELVKLSTDVFNAGECFFAGHTGEPIQQATHRVCVGQPIGNFYGWKSVGLGEDGRWLVEDTLGQAISIDDIGDQRHVIGNGIPDHFAALNTSVRYKAFDVSANMRGAFGHQILNFMRLYYENPTRNEYNMLRSALDPVYGKELTSELAYVSHYVEDGDFWKLDNVTLGYTFDTASLPLGLSNALTRARIYVSGRNLWTLTGYQGMDPEVRITGLDPGTDHRDQYPTTRTFTTGVNLVF
jgi:TonB-linked SusC/RagA family outer membrane protein